MSSRYYPIYQMGNPQLRVFLPNFYMKLVKPTEPQPPNVVLFRVPIAMTDYDIKSYLEKIYNVPVMHVSSEMKDAPIKKNEMNYVVKQGDDYRLATVTLPRDMKFEFPNLNSAPVKTDDEEKQEKQMKNLQKSYDANAKIKRGRFGLPIWYNV